MEGHKVSNMLVVEPAMTETKSSQDAAVAPCPKCGWMKFNPNCSECREIQQQCLLLGARMEGFDM